MGLGLEVLVLSNGSQKNRKSHAQRMGRKVETIPTSALEALTRYDWPGNIRELQKDRRSVDARLIDIQAFRLIRRDLSLPIALVLATSPLFRASSDLQAGNRPPASSLRCERRTLGIRLVAAAAFGH